MYNAKFIEKEKAKRKTIVRQFMIYFGSIYTVRVKVIEK